MTSKIPGIDYFRVDREKWKEVKFEILNENIKLLRQKSDTIKW